MTSRLAAGAADYADDRFPANPLLPIAMKVYQSLLAPALLSLSLASCASIMTGSTDSVSVESIPSGAFFRTNTGMTGHTPQIINVPASHDLVVDYQMQGYEPQSATLDSRVSGWIVGNLVFGGLIGIVIDVVNPDARTHDKCVRVELVAQEGGTEPEPSRIHQTSARAMPKEISIGDPPTP